MMSKLSDLQTLVKPYVNQGIVIADQYLNKAEVELYRIIPQVSLMNNFEKFLLLNAVLIIFILAIRILLIFSPIKIYRSCVQKFFRLPMVRKKIDEQLEKTRKEFMDSYPEQFRSTIKSIPYSPVVPTVGNKCEIESTKGYLSGSRYLDKKNCDFISNLAK